MKIKVALLHLMVARLSKDYINFEKTVKRKRIKGKQKKRLGDNFQERSEN